MIRGWAELWRRGRNPRQARFLTAEFRAPRLAVFDRADTNHDGVITPAEAQAAAAGGKK